MLTETPQCGPQCPVGMQGRFLQLAAGKREMPQIFALGALERPALPVGKQCGFSVGLEQGEPSARIAAGQAAYNRPPNHRLHHQGSAVRMTGPLGVMATVCSK